MVAQLLLRLREAHFEQSVYRSFRSKYGRQSLSEIRRLASNDRYTLRVGRVAAPLVENLCLYLVRSTGCYIIRKVI